MWDPLPRLDEPHGVITVELFDARSGRLLRRERKHNFIALSAKQEFLFAQMDRFGGNFPGQFQHPYLWPAACFSTIYLGSDSSPESPSTERFVRGQLVGWADRTSTYSGGDTLRGTINVSESTWSTSRAHFVFDWPTNAANGTIASVGFAGFRSLPVQQYCSTFPVGSTSVQGDNGRGMVYANGYVYYLDGNNLLSKIDPNTGNVVDTTYVQVTDNPSNLAFDGTSFWVCSGNKLYRLNADGTVASNLTLTRMPWIRAFTIDGGYIWVYCDNGNNYSQTNKSYSASLYKFDLSGNLSGIIPNTLGSPISMVVASNQLYGVNGLSCTIADKQGNWIANFGTTYYTPVQVGAYAALAPDGVSYYIVDSRGYLSRIWLGALGSRVLLSSPIQKNNTQTLKVTYDITYNLLPSW